jgi:tripeptidyl-peptidase-1
MGYSLPRELHSHVGVITPTTYFSTVRSMCATYIVQSESTEVGSNIGAESAPAAVPPSSCNTVITPTCLRTLYNTNGYVPAATNVNKLGVAGYLNEYANRADLQVRPSYLVITSS